MSQSLGFVIKKPEQASRYVEPGVGDISPAGRLQRGPDSARIPGLLNMEIFSKFDNKDRKRYICIKINRLY
jgi:hypothetical protein